ncbi:MAG: uroporphyrinogen-III C-methyltransferase [Nitrosopumilus sp.]|nr:uroporphyrinogen-III C-methyltransferase [Nitrosopumilus sp.]
MRGRVYLVGAGPGDPGLLTLRAAELLARADVVLYDRLVSRGVLALARGAKKVYVGRAIGDDPSHQETTNEAMARYAGSHRVVVRLKGGDPVMFGRGGEEAQFLRGLGIRYEIVPGITSGIGSATYAGIPLTHRGHSSSVVFVTGHEDPTKRRESVKWRRLARSADTIVVMMGLSRLPLICEMLESGGLDGSTPAAVITDGTTKRQKVIEGDLSSIASRARRAGARPPAIVVIGGVASLRGELAWRR